MRSFLSSYYQYYIYAFLKFFVFIVKSFYEVQDSHPAGCGDKGLTYDECNEALNILGYNIVDQSHKDSWNDRPKGCVIADMDGDTFYLDSFFNEVTGNKGSKFKSICFPGTNYFS